MSQSTQDLETRDGLAHGLLQPAEGGTSAPDQVLADLRVANLARAIADGERIAMWALGAEALALVLREGPLDR